MADSWTITGGDRDTVQLTIVVGATTSLITVKISDVDKTSQATMAASLRAVATAYKAAVVAKQTAPALLTANIGYTEAL